MRKTIGIASFVLASMSMFSQSEFSPNGDGVNDTLKFKSVNMECMSTVIYDKDNKIFYQTEGMNSYWDGTDVRGRKAKEGTYFIVQTAVGIDGRNYEQKATIKLTR